ncbi:I78 family peptidase inhibitor [Caenispirillum bisanense]|uniref:Peptidase inhibitor I78 family protein n=1 Tax=Caenispirillum bisanense TaxID=414052 RepID=A0A286GXL9_9PROT|nr:I78 family peptidase inhibitor [Caenispirillum bisanense]SOD99814.1 Peptidase inhibitor I78 family protein [Caenispirillum bisanense]
MRRAPTATVLAAALTLAACASEPPPPPEPPLERPPATASAESLEACGAGDLAGAIGGRLVPGEAAAGELSVADLPRPYRVIAPGTPTDLSFRPDRLTVTLTGDGTIRQMTCG